MLPVLIIEDHPLVAQATGTLLLSEEPLVAVELALDAAQALARVDEVGRDWYRIFLDLDVPGAVGLSLARELQQRGLARRTCVISATHRPEFVALIRDWGFLGYIIKAKPLDEFQAALGRALRGQRTFDSASPLDPAPIRLTRRQTEMLDLVRLGLSSKQIASHLHLSSGTVNNHMGAILHALKAETRAQAVARAIEWGLLTPRTTGLSGVTGFALPDRATR